MIYEVLRFSFAKYSCTNTSTHDPYIPQQHLALGGVHLTGIRLSCITNGMDLQTLGVAMIMCLDNPSDNLPGNQSIKSIHPSIPIPISILPIP
ncbi:hypothetical protein EYC80_002450 [Monilinia laxa]|uniref:Uncharacterized protein n=1 Tax=Monilinia laxa TaxID=61186 RepID=A0A5N6K3X7_MONLA|nr:hypothetical protein EYC80_002450 [Monilinia laxa]